MKTPRLNRRLMLEAQQRIPDGGGGFVETWTALGELWAEVTARSGRERAGPGLPLSAVSYRIVVRAAPPGAPARPMPEQRFREGARIFAILAVTEHDRDSRYLTCFAEEETVA